MSTHVCMHLDVTQSSRIHLKLPHHACQLVNYDNALTVPFHTSMHPSTLPTNLDMNSTNLDMNSTDLLDTEKVQFFATSVDDIMDSFEVRYGEDSYRLPNLLQPILDRVKVSEPRSLQTCELIASQTMLLAATPQPPIDAAVPPAELALVDKASTIIHEYRQASAALLLQLRQQMLLGNLLLAVELHTESSPALQKMMREIFDLIILIVDSGPDMKPLAQLVPYVPTPLPLSPTSFFTRPRPELKHRNLRTRRTRRTCK